MYFIQINAPDQLMIQPIQILMNKKTFFKPMTCKFVMGLLLLWII